MTCVSCAHYRAGGRCALGNDGVPMPAGDCPAFDYEPGSDEGEGDE